MTDNNVAGTKPVIYFVGRYEPEAANGVLKVLYSYSQILSDMVDFNFVSLSLDHPKGYEVETRDRITIHRFGKPFFLGFSLPGEVRDWVAQIPKDAIFHLHGVFRPINYAFARLLTKHDIRYLYTPHDSYDKMSLQSKAIQKRVYIELFEKYILQNASKIHALTPKGIQNISRYTANEIVEIPNFILPPHIQPPPLETRKNICFIGRLDVFQKGLDLMLPAFRLFRECHAEPVQFLVIGPDSEQSMPSLTQKCQKMGLDVGKDVIFTGELSEEEKWKTLNSCRVYFQLSRFEGFGLSVVEALALGVPVVISGAIPISRAITSRNAGRVVMSPEEAAQALEALFRLSDDDYEALSGRARLTYQTLYSSEIVKEQILQMYLGIAPKLSTVDLELAI